MAGLSLAALTACAGLALAECGSPDPYVHETQEERDARMAWWREAKFGMFIHWGVYAVPAGTYDGKQISGIGEWIMNRGKIPRSDYRAYAEQFNPVHYDPDAWVRLAKSAGMKYIVITSKHHDGFTLYPSDASEWGIGMTPHKQDLLAPLADACRKHGLKLGFYYSQAQDWVNGGAGNGWDPLPDRSMDDYITGVAVPQVREILTRYGEFPSVLWWDTPANMNAERAAPLIELLKLKPGIIHNNRLGGGFKGDTDTPEQHIPATGIAGRDWETCMTMNNTWGFKSYDDNWKSTRTLVHNLVDIVSKGGNYLLNVGPTADGRIPEPSITGLQEVGAWMKVNGEAIYGTSANPLPKQAWGRCTHRAGKKGGTLYLHVFNWPEDGRLLVRGLANRVKSGRLLAKRGSLKTDSTEAGVVIHLPAEAPDPDASVIRLKYRGPLDIRKALLRPDDRGTYRLEPELADFKGRILVEQKEGKSNLGYWVDADDTAAWQLAVPQDGAYRVSAELASAEKSAFTVSSGESTLRIETVSSGGYNTFRRVDMGVLEIEKGTALLEIRPDKGAWSPVNFRELILTPVGSGD